VTWGRFFRLFVSECVLRERIRRRLEREATGSETREYLDSRVKALIDLELRELGLGDLVRE